MSTKKLNELKAENARLREQLRALGVEVDPFGDIEGLPEDSLTELRQLYKTADDAGKKKLLGFVKRFMALYQEYNSGPSDLTVIHFALLDGEGSMPGYPEVAHFVSHLLLPPRHIMRIVVCKSLSRMVLYPDTVELDG